MLRRTFLDALAALPVVSVPERLTQSRDASSATKIQIAREGDMWFWFYAYLACKDSGMSTERARDHAVTKMELTSLNDRQARHILEQAAHDEFTLDDMPDRWRRVMESIDQVEFT